MKNEHNSKSHLFAKTNFPSFFFNSKKMTSVQTVTESDMVKENIKTIPSIFHLREFDLVQHAVIGGVKSGVYNIIDISNALKVGKKVKIQMSGGGSLPPFCVDSSQFGQSIVVNISDNAEFMALSKLQENILDIAVERRNDWFPGSTVSDSQLREKFILLAHGGKTNKKGSNVLHDPTAKFAFEESHLQPKTNEKTGITAKNALLRVVDEEKKDVELCSIPGRRWKTIIFTIQCIYIQKSGTFGITRRLNYLEVGEPSAFGVASKALEVSNYDLVRDGILGPNMIPKEKFAIVPLENNDGSKITLRFSGGGRLPSFAVDKSQFGADILTFNIGDIESKSLEDLEKTIKSLVVKNRTDWMPSNKSSDDDLMGDLMYKIITPGKEKKDSPGNFWPATMKTNFKASEVNAIDSKCIILDVVGQNVDPADLAGRNWISIDIMFTCVYIQGGAKGKYGVSRHLVKLVVDLAEDNDDEPLSGYVTPAKRRKTDEQNISMLLD
jgi:hypothetical protein